MTKPIYRIPEFNQSYKDELVRYYNSSLYLEQRNQQNPIIPYDAVNYVRKIYESGYGIKVIARELGLTYTKTRGLFNKLNIPIKTGRSVVYSHLKKFRKELVAGPLNPWSDWTAKPQGRNYKMGRGLQGYYKTDTKKVWLRSTWEYIYAKWLDANSINWTTEAIEYELANGDKYRPDFNIFDNNGKLIKIVEIKGFYKNRLYKTDMLYNEYGITVEVIDDITPYTTIGYSKERKIWNESKLKK